MHPGTIEVAVLPPVDSSRWQASTVRRHAAEVRDLFATTLAHWPGRGVSLTPGCGQSDRWTAGRAGQLLQTKHRGAARGSPKLGACCG